MNNNSDLMHSTLRLCLASFISFAVGAGVTYLLLSRQQAVSRQLACPPSCFSANIFGSPGCYDLAAAKQGILRQCN